MTPRENIAPGIRTPERDEAYARARKGTVIAFKVCGAGGGGCFFIILPEKNPEIREAVKAAVLQSSEIRHLPFEAVPHGLTVRT